MNQFYKATESSRVFDEANGIWNDADPFEFDKVDCFDKNALWRPFLETMTMQLPDTGKNFACSPVSLFTALLLVSQLKNRPKQDELFSLVGITPETVCRLIRSLSASHSSEERPENTFMQHSLWIDRSLIPNSPALRKFGKENNTSVYTGKLHSEKAASQLKAWVKQATNGADAPFVPKNINAVLFSSLRYSGRWIARFEREMTAPEVFYLKNGRTKTCDFMNSRSLFDFRLYRAENFIAVRTMLQDRSNAYFILPNEGVSLDSVKTDRKMAELIFHPGSVCYEDREVKLSLPKCSLQTSVNTADILKAVGCSAFFEGSLKQVIYKYKAAALDMMQSAKLEWDEEGIRGMALTECSFCSGFPDPKPLVEIKFNRPFLFALMFRNLPLFIGTVTDPGSN